MPKSRKAKRYFEPKKKAENDVATPAVSAPGIPPVPARATSARVKSIAQRYPYVTSELKRIAILTGVIIIILVVLALVLP
jgi:hypothetical protein